MKVDIGSSHVFTELAKYCLDNKERNLTSLALKLIELEPHLARRCIVVLLIFLTKKEAQNVDKLLDCAEQSGDSSVIHYTLQSLRRVSSDWLPAKIWQEILSKRPML